MSGNIERVLLVRLNTSLIREAGHPRAFRPPFTLKYIQALLTERKYYVKLVDCAIQTISLNELVDFSLSWFPQMIIISATSLESELVAKYIYALKKQNRNVFIVITGQVVTERLFEHPSYSEIDFALKGEVELEAVNLINKINKGECIDNLKTSYKKQLSNPPIVVENLDDLPFPFYNSLELEKYNFVYPLKIYKRLKWGHVLSSKGCPYDCIFCSQITRESYGKKIRLRNPQNIIDEIEMLISKGVNVISFDDDNFTTLREHVIGVCQEMIKRNLKIAWICHARIDNLTEDLLVLMKQAGCVLLRCGIEAGAERILKVLKKGEPSCWKQKAKEVFLQAKKIRIATDALFLIGNPSETKQEIKESIKLSKYLSPDIIQVAFFTPYPGSSAYEEYKNRLTSIPISQMYHYKFPVVNFSQIDLKELIYLQKKFYSSFLLNLSFVFGHIRQYGLFYLYNFDVLYKLLYGLIKVTGFTRNRNITSAYVY
ncbi:MAG: radical SAM protein [Candidatus Omnitrophica bacterium]|nr:radical SAM protein [Candidatus Omnitrophota bacterium]